MVQAHNLQRLAYSQCAVNPKEMLKSLVSYFWPQNDDNLSLEGVYNVLNKATSDEDCESEDTEITEQDDNYACFHKTGVITEIDGDKYIIDNIYECKENKFPLEIGMKVSFITYNSKSKLCVTNVEVIENGWNYSEGAEKFNWFNRSLISKVVKRDGRNIFVSPGDVVIDLNSVSTEFIPLIGDWVELDLKCEADETMTDLFGRILEVNKISPVRPKIAEGNVKAWNSDEQTGVINQNIFFNRESLCVGYIPANGDKVVAEIIESEQGRCSWRALKVLPDDIKREFEVLNLVSEQIEREEVRVSEDVFINNPKISDNQRFEFTLLNTSSLSLSLVGVEFQKVNSQCRIIQPEHFPVMILPNESIIVEGIYYVNTAGQLRESLTFVFKDFKVVRWINVVIKSELEGNYGQRYTKKAQSNSGVYKCNSTNGKEIVRGQKPQMPPRFIPHSLPEYRVPQKLWNVILKYGNNFKNTQLLLEDLMSVKPVLRKPLAFQCYEDRFHTLLHLEEISNIQAATIYERDRVCFIKNGEYLMLEIENLSEQRPSIINGDTFIASDPYQTNSPNFEGFVHKVGAKHVHLKFSPIFHSTYNGEDYSVRVVQSRSQVRKMHQAIGLVTKNLGRDFLFPSKVVCKEHQSNFTYDKYDDSFQDNVVSKTPPKMSNAEILNLLRVRVSAEKLKIDSENVNTKLLLENGHVNECPLPKNVKQFKLEWFDKSLNFYQKEAVRNILLGEARPLPYFIFGPPGTGKTVTLIETILQLLRVIPHSRLLVATPSNSSADLIALRLIESGVLKPGDLVRYVAYRYVVEGNIPKKIAPYCATGNIAKDGTSSQSTIITESGLVLGCSSVVLGRQRITVGTCGALGYLFLMDFPKGHFTHVIIDEAAQATEPEVMIPLSFLDVSSGQVILAGDPMQLGPVVTSKYAAELGLSEAFMERMLYRFPYVRDIEGFPNTGGYDPRLVTKLVYNYRSLPEILELPNSMFYYSELLPTISAEDSAEAKLLRVIKEILPARKTGLVPSFVVHGVNGSDYQTLDSPSWFNPDEISQVFFYINQLYRLGLTPKDIGVISPYIKQVKQIRSLLVEAEFDLPKVGTVEEFQGQEFNVVLLSTVRSCLNMVESDKKYNLGFVANPRRLNVALTRAKSLIIIIGNPHLLVTDSFWRNILTYAVENGSYCGCDLPSSLCNIENKKKE